MKSKFLLLAVCLVALCASFASCEKEEMDKGLSAGSLNPPRDALSVETRDGGIVAETND